MSDILANNLEGITPEHIKIIEFVRLHKGLSPKEIANSLGIDGRSIQGKLLRLKKYGFVALRDRKVYPLTTSLLYTNTVPEEDTSKEDESGFVGLIELPVWHAISKVLIYFKDEEKPIKLKVDTGLHLRVGENFQNVKSGDKVFYPVVGVVVKGPDGKREFAGGDSQILIISEYVLYL